jgi:hypothetical protein
MILNFKKWFENLAYEKTFAQRDITQKANVGKMLGIPGLFKYKQGSFATLYQHPKKQDQLIKITSHKKDVYNLVRAQKLNSSNIIKLFDWENKEKIKELPELNSLAIIVEKIDGSPMAYTTNDFYELSLNGKFELAGDWMMHGGNDSQKFIMNRYQLNNDQEHNKLHELFNTLQNLRKYRIELTDFEDNIMDNGNKYVIIDMGF